MILGSMGPSIFKTFTSTFNQPSYVANFERGKEVAKKDWHQGRALMKEAVFEGRRLAEESKEPPSYARIKLESEYANQLFHNGEYDSAKEQYLQCIPLVSAIPEGKDWQSFLLESAAWCDHYLYKEGKLNKSASEKAGSESSQSEAKPDLKPMLEALKLRQGLGSQPTSMLARVMYRLGELYCDNGDAKSAQQYFKQSEEVFPDASVNKDGDVLMGKFRASYMMGQYQEANKHFAEALRQTKDDDHSVHRLSHNRDDILAKIHPDADKQPFHASVRALLKARNYSALDQLASKLRQSKEEMPNGLWKLDDMYAALDHLKKHRHHYSDAQWKEHLDRLRDWSQKNPQSISALVALAEGLTSYAWKARGGGWADSVTPEGWKNFGKRLDEAKEILDGADKLKETCPHAYRVRQIVALGKSWEKKEFDEVVARAVKECPDYENIYFYKAYYLLPRWHGEEGEWEEDLKTNADKFGATHGAVKGDVLYARTVWYIDRMVTGDPLNEFKTLSWPRVKKGFEALRKEFPDSAEVKDEYAKLGILAGDLKSADEAYK